MESKLPLIRHSIRWTASIAKRWPITTGFVAVGTSVFGIVGAGEALTSPSYNVAATPKAHLADPDSLFDARSPGGRRYGRLFNTKQPRTGFDVGPPDERVLTSVRRHPGAPVLPSDTPAVVPFSGPDSVFEPAPSQPTDDALLDAADPTGTGGVFVPTGAAVGGVLPGPGGVSGGPGTGGTPGDGDTVTPAPAVPEPATWGMLVLGFFAIGGLMRRRQPNLQFHEAR
jgi:hypothetical protein